MSYDDDRQAWAMQPWDYPQSLPQLPRDNLPTTNPIVGGGVGAPVAPPAAPIPA